MISLFLIKEVIQVKKSDQDIKLRILDIGSYTIAGILIISMLYTDYDLTFLFVLVIISLPFGIYNFYQYYKVDKKRLAYSVSVFVAFLVIIGIAAYL